MNGWETPGSTSALGGALRQQAITLVDLMAELDEAAARAARAGPSDRWPASGTARPGGTGGSTRSGRPSSPCTATVLAGSARTRALADEAALADLVIEGSLVVEARGPSRSDPTRRMRARERLQELLNRVTAAEAKEIGRIAREVERSGPARASLSAQARSGT